MPLMIILPIGLRIVAALVFVIAIIFAGASNRSVLLVPALAAAATLGGLVKPKIGLNLQNPDVEPPSRLSRATGMFTTRLVAYGILFGLSVLIAAMFRETGLERQITMFDAGLVAVPLVLGYLLTEISNRMGLGQAASIMGDVQSAFADMKTSEAEDEAFTIDGTVTGRGDDPANDA